MCVKFCAVVPSAVLGLCVSLLGTDLDTIGIHVAGQLAVMHICSSCSSCLWFDSLLDPGQCVTRTD